MKLRILLIDNDSTWRELLLAAVQGLSCRVEMAASVAEGYASLLDRPFGLILLASRLPDGPGDVLLDSIRAMPDPPPVIMVASFADTADRVDAYENGAVSILYRSHGLKELHALMDVELTRCWQSRRRIPVGRAVFDMLVPQFEIDGQVVRLTPIDHRLFVLLLRAHGALVSCADLRAAADITATGPSGANSLQSHLSSLRSKVAPAGVDLINIKEAGYALRSTATDDAIQGSAHPVQPSVARAEPAPLRVGGSRAPNRNSHR